MAMDIRHDCFLELLPAIVAYPQLEVSPHAISLVKEMIEQLLPLVSSPAVVAANLNVWPDLLHESENYDHEWDHNDAHHTVLARKLDRR
jgi:hypothetical protein